MSDKKVLFSFWLGKILNPTNNRTKAYMYINTNRTHNKMRLMNLHELKIKF